MFDLLRQAIRRAVGWVGGIDLAILLGLLVAVVGVWAFFHVAGAVRAGATQQLDELVLRSLRRPDEPAIPLGPVWLHEMGRDLTALGGVAVLLLITASVAGFLLLSRKYQALALLLLAILGGLLLSTLLKRYFDRPRP